MCKGCTFLANGRLIRQVDGCPMGGPISVVLSNIFCVKMEFNVVKPLKPKLYKRYIDDIFSKWIKNQPDELFEKLNNYHPNIKLTIEVNPSKFLDNVTIRWGEHSDISKNSEPVKYFNQFPEHRFNWKILRRGPNIVRQRKIHEAYYVVYAPYP